MSWCLLPFPSSWSPSSLFSVIYESACLLLQSIGCCFLGFACKWYHDVCFLSGFLHLGASLVAQRLKHLPATGFNPWVGKIPWRRKWQPTPVFLPGESHGRRSLVGYCPWGCKESDMTERLHFTSLHFLHLRTLSLGPSLLPHMALFCSFLWLSTISLCVSNHVSFHPFLCWWTFRLFPCLGCCE